MSLLLIVMWGAAMLAVARLLCGSWVNHLGVYTFVWTLSLSAYELHWIGYNPISAEAWLYIFVAWIAIYLGTALVVLMSRPRRPEPLGEKALRDLRTVIILFGLAGLGSCAVLAREIMREIDPNLLVAVTAGGPRIYAANLAETGQFGGIPYVGFLPFAACVLAGIYTARRGRLDWVGFLPLLVAVVTAILSVSRWTILLSSALCIVSFLVTPKTREVRLSRVQKLLLALLAAAGLVAVSLTRTDLSAALTGEDTVLSHTEEVVSFAPSLYFYVSAPPIGFSSYLRDASQEANQPWGRFTFASIYRILSKAGITSAVPFHQEFYSTPEAVNTCTYLREIHSDFGPLGVFLFPFTLGAAVAWLSGGDRSLVRTVLLTHLYVIVFFSFTYLVVITGQFFQSLLFSTVAAVFIEKYRGHAKSRERVAGRMAPVLTQ